MTQKIMESMMDTENQLRSTWLLQPAAKMDHDLLPTPYPGCDAAIDQTGTVHCACQYVITKRPQRTAQAEHTWVVR